MTNVTSLLKTVKAVEDEAAKGPRALEQTIHAINTEARVRNCISYIRFEIHDEEIAEYVGFYLSYRALYLIFCAGIDAVILGVFMSRYRWLPKWVSTTASHLRQDPSKHHLHSLMFE